MGEVSRSATKTRKTNDLVAAWRSGRKTAGNILLERYYPQLLALAHRLFPAPLRGQADPEDFVQEACKAACEGLNQYRYLGKGAFGSWLFKLLEYQVWLRWRRERAQIRDIRKNRPLPDNYPDQSKKMSPLEQLSLLEDIQQLERALAGMHRDHRSVIEARYYDSKTWEEIAEQFGRTKEAVEMLLVRALKSLKKHFAHRDRGVASAEAI